MGEQSISTGSVTLLPGPGAERPTADEPFRTLGLAAAHAAAAAAGGRQAEQPSGIPKILHRIYIADPNDAKRSNFTMPIAHHKWIRSCQLHYSARAGWSYYFWDLAAADALIANHFPWFLDFWQRNASKAIEKSDLLRYAVLHHVGGLYLDSDIECWREGGDLLEGWDGVLQATHGAEGVTNAIIAARPGLEVFTKALQLVQQRPTDKGPIGRTGPDLLADALVAVGLQRRGGMFDKEVLLDGVVYRLYRVGAFFTPCQWWEQDCRRRIYRERASGQIDMRYLVGMHRMVGSWMAGKMDGIGIINVTAELCGTATHERGNGQVGGWVAPKRTGGRRRRWL